MALVPETLQLKLASNGNRNTKQLEGWQILSNLHGHYQSSSYSKINKVRGRAMNNPIIFHGILSCLLLCAGEAWGIISISSQPVSAAVNIGQSVTFSVAATGASNFSYQWKRDNIDISGATATSYQLSTVAIPDNGASFSVSVTSGAETIQSLSANLTVCYAPVISKQPVSQTIMLGDPVEFSVEYDRGNLSESIQWFRNGTAISGAVGPTYTISSFSSTDEGSQFKVAISNSIGSVLSNTAIIFDASKGTVVQNPNGSSSMIRAGYSDNQCDVITETIKYESTNYIIFWETTTAYKNKVTVRNCTFPVGQYATLTGWIDPDLTDWGPLIKDALEQFPFKGTTRPAEITWSTANDVIVSNQSFQKYDASNYSVEVVYTYPGGAPLSAFPLIPDPVRAGMYMDDKKTYAWNMYPYSGANNSPRWFAKVKYGPDGRYFALVSLFPGFTDTNPFNKPLVIGDAFDPANQRMADKLIKKTDYRNLLNSVDNGNMLSPRYQGYDVYFLDFSQGAGDIHINAGLELTLLRWVQTNGATQAVVGGISMSGIIGRLSMLYSMPANNVQGLDYGKTVYGFLTIDSPHQGAQINSYIQEYMYRMSGNWRIDALTYLINESNPTIQAWNQLSTPATYQMLYSHFYIGGGSKTAGHDAFYDFLAAKGSYRPGPKVAIAYSNFYDHTGIFTTSPMLDPAIPYYATRIQPTSMAATDFKTELHEFDPGSTTGDVYFDVFKNKPTTFVSWLPGLFTQTNYNYWWLGKAGPNKILPGRFNGTFVPINSALDINSNAPLFIGTKPDETMLQSHSPFNKIYYMKNDYNGYCDVSNSCSKLDVVDGRKSPDSKRYQHIVFDSQVMTALNSGLNYLERVNAVKKSLPAVLNLLL